MVALSRILVIGASGTIGRAVLTEAEALAALEPDRDGVDEGLLDRA